MIFTEEMLTNTTYGVSFEEFRQNYNDMRLDFEPIADRIIVQLDIAKNEGILESEIPHTIYADADRRFSIPAIEMNLLVLNNNILRKHNGLKQYKIKREPNSITYIAHDDKYSYGFNVVERTDDEYEPQNLADPLTFSKLADEIYKNTKLYRMGKNMLVKYVVWTKMKACYAPWELHKIEKILYRENNLQRRIVRSILPDTDGKYTYYAFKEVGRPIVEFVDNKEQS